MNAFTNNVTVRMTIQNSEQQVFDSGLFDRKSFLLTVIYQQIATFSLQVVTRIMQFVHSWSQIPAYLWTIPGNNMQCFIQIPGLQCGELTWLEGKGHSSMQKFVSAESFWWNFCICLGGGSSYLACIKHWLMFMSYLSIIN